ncbi:MAG: hypothetical protein KAT34_22330 [Candidatus Aminicenantes bacterium]|nr:hypothetical protein [Candidatus Aminicenantes bacterium]
MEKAELIDINATFYELVDFLRHLPKADAKGTIDNLGQVSVDKIIENSITENRSITSLIPGLRALKTKGLLEKLGASINPSLFLKMLEKQGTFFDFLQILQYLGQAMQKDLAGDLSGELTARLVDKDVEGKRIINSILRELNLLKRLYGGFNRDFEEKIGVNYVLKLIFNNGNLRLLCELIGNLSEEDVSRFKLIETFHALPGNKKEEFILRGDFHKCCSAMADCRQLNIFPQNGGGFSVKEAAILNRLLDKSTFKSINRGLGSLDYFPDKKLKFSLFKLVAAYIDKMGPETATFNSVSERVAYLSILHRLARLNTNSIETLTAHIKEEEFLQEKDFIGSFQLLQYIVTVNDVSPLLRKEILTLSNSDKIINKLGKETTLKAFLYLWNTYALFVQEELQNFDDWLNPGIVTALYQVVEKHKRTRANVEAIRHLLMIVGLLDYLDIEPERIGKIFFRGFRLLNLSRPFLSQALKKASFIPGFFYLKGIDLFANKPLFPNKWKILIPRLFDLNLKAKGVGELVDVFQRKIRKRIIPV